MSNDNKKHCTAKGCDSHDLDECAYVDRHGNGCWTDWCDRHSAHFAGLIYCKRHANTMAGLSTPFSEPPPLPAVSNRTASLLRWMAQALEKPIRDVLDHYRDDNSENLLGDYPGAVGAVDHPDAPVRVWPHRWQVIEQGGKTAVTVTLSVDEGSNDVAVIAVNSETVHRATPPWITHHRRHEAVDPGTDERERREYVEAIVASVNQAVNGVRRGR